MAKGEGKGRSWTGSCGFWEAETVAVQGHELFLLRSEPSFGV